MIGGKNSKSGEIYSFHKVREFIGIFIPNICFVWPTSRLVSVLSLEELLD